MSLAYWGTTLGFLYWAEFKHDDSSILPALAWFGLAIVMAVYGGVWGMVVASHLAKERRRALQPLAEVNFDEHIAGLESLSNNVPVVCYVTQSEFYFAPPLSSGGEQSLPRESIIRIHSAGQEHITQRLTATRLLTLGVLALAAPKKEQNAKFCVLIDWGEDEANPQQILFAFKGADAQRKATDAANSLRKYVNRPPKAAVHPPIQTGLNAGTTERLTELKSLSDSGLISAEEYETTRNAIISQLSMH